MAEETVSLWTQREREIFELVQGNARRKYDPAVLLRRYQAAAHKAGGVKKVAEAYELLGLEQVAIEAGKEFEREQEAGEAAILLVDVGRDVFEARPFSDANPDGWTETEVLGAVSQFFYYLGKKKMKAKNSPLSSTAAGEASDASQATANTSPS